MIHHESYELQWFTKYGLSGTENECLSSDVYRMFKRKYVKYCDAQLQEINFINLSVHLSSVTALEMLDAFSRNLILENITKIRQRVPIFKI
jgi:hypothetical protein